MLRLVDKEAIVESGKLTFLKEILTFLLVCKICRLYLFIYNNHLR